MKSVNSDELYVAVLAGGSGTRLWPLSTSARPKPFVSLGPLGSLYSATARRVRRLRPSGAVTIGSPALARWCRAKGLTYLAEPAPRNTAAAVALAGADALRRMGPDGLLLVLPADHHVGDPGRFALTVARLARVCKAHRVLGVMGIRPTGPETAYGYIESGDPLGEGFRLRRFVEKPDREKAQALLAEGRASWNSGMFLFPVGRLREEMGLHCPGVWEASEAWLERGDPRPYLALPSISVDYALMEKSAGVAMVPADFSWSDVGTYPSLHRILPRDPEGNAGWGPRRVENCSDCLLITDRPALFKDLRGMAVIRTREGSLAVPLDGADGIRSGVEALQEDVRSRERTSVRW
ncbi:MAG: mannose-1-phosphate guanylyltransferase [Acidobacteriota bacterium]